MADLKALYIASSNATVAAARAQATNTAEAVKDGVNFFDSDSEYQDNFETRKYRDKTVTQATGDDTTNGKFTETARLFYQDLYDALSEEDKANMPASQRDSETHYLTVKAAEKGVTQSYRP